MTKNHLARQAISETCDEIKLFLLHKNDAYGNAAFDPIRCFSKAGPDEQLSVRIDDKISRLMRGHAAGEDVEKDLLGYLILKAAYDKYIKLHVELESEQS